MASQQYNYVQLTIAGSAEGEAMAVGGDDLIVGSAYLQGSSSRSAVVWTLNNSATILTGLGAGARSFGASTTGIVVGYGATPAHALIGIAWTNAIPSELPTLGGSTSGAYGVNSRGIAVGFADLAGNSQQHATMWVHGVPHDIGTLGGSNSVAYAINATGAIAGTELVKPKASKP